MLKRALDLTVAVAALVVASPVLILATLAVYVQDFHSPFYVAPRVGRNSVPFRMVKLRSMRVGADRTGVDSTSADDRRITAIGQLLRRYKLDELSQLWNVLIGDMSLVGPRPNVPREVAIFTEAERELLKVRPGITDLASIVFADEGDILAGKPDPDLTYNQIIRPWKSRLALLYVRRPSVWLDLHIIFLTALALVSRRRALEAIQPVLTRLGADPLTLEMARRVQPLQAYPPPGATAIVTQRA